MLPNQIKQTSRIGFVLLILLSGIAFIPFTQLSAEQLGWQALAGIYEANLDVDPNKGLPGSAFRFSGDSYQPNALATLYLDGTPIGTLPTDAQGNALFLIQTNHSDQLDRYDVALATDANTSASKDFNLEDDEPLASPPANFLGPIFDLSGPLTDSSANGDITNNGHDLILAWADFTVNCGYEIHRSTAAHFTPGPTTLLATLPTGSYSYNVANSLGNPSVNYYYQVAPINCGGGLLETTNTLGAFDFGLHSS